MLPVDPSVLAVWPEWRRVYWAGMLLLWPPADQRAAIDAIRARIDPVTHAECSAHITVTPPFQRPPSARDWVAVERVLSRFEPFPCRATRLRRHRPAPVVWLDAEPAETICALRAALIETELFVEEPPYPGGFQPHLTLTEGRAGRSVDDALADELLRKAPSVAFDCWALGYAVPDAEFHVRLDRFLPLGSDPNLRGVDEVVRRLRAWAADRSDCRALALVGSHARGEGRADSDVHFVLLVDEPDAYLRDLSWTADFGPVKSVGLETYGRVTSVRIQRRDGPEVELGIAPRDWAEEPHDSGTWDVATNGLLVSFDRDGALVELCDAVGHGVPRPFPSDSGSD